MRVNFQPIWPLAACRAALCALALILWACVPVAVQAETLEGQFERGAKHSVLWVVSGESGDLIGQVFTNTSQVGKLIFSNCLPKLNCVVEGAEADDVDEQMVAELNFDAPVSGWWHIVSAQSAHMTASLPMKERDIQTRFGELEVTKDQQLMFKGIPVRGNPFQSDFVPANGWIRTPPPTSFNEDKPYFMMRMRTSWKTFTDEFSQNLRKWFRRDIITESYKNKEKSELDIKSPEKYPLPISSQVVQGRSELYIVAHFDGKYHNYNHDVVLLQSIGDARCPATYSFATLTAYSIVVTPEFGSCSDIATFWWKATGKDGTYEPFVTMSGVRGAPSEPLESGLMRLHHFILHDGKILATMPAD
ncbi:hypothetical protein AwPolaro_02050 [Polaromonas sp.]|nr:hypothetical protein AwPolaro_02050 [Polaromonas sp.]